MADNRVYNYLLPVSINDLHLKLKGNTFSISLNGMPSKKQ